jgi:hypothetical protein
MAAHTGDRPSRGLPAERRRRYDEPMEGCWRGVPVVAAVVCLLSALAVGGCIGTSDESPRADPVEPIATTRPAATFAPLIRLHPDESAFPISVDRFVERSSLKWKNGADCIALDDVATGRIADRKTVLPVPRLDPARLGGARAPYRRRPDRSCGQRDGLLYRSTELTRPYDEGRRSAGLEADEGFYLDLLSDSHDGDPVAGGDGRPAPGDVPVYYEREMVRVHGRSGLRITYWLLYAHSDSRDAKGLSVLSHEGDWERVDVLLERRGERRWIPVEIAFGSPEARLRTVPWRELERSGSHPVVFSARDSHTSYARAGEHRRRVPAGRRGGGRGRGAAVLDETATCDDCASWRTWALLAPVRAQPWYGFGGGWGLAFEKDAMSGPLGPRPASGPPGAPTD